MRSYLDGFSIVTTGNMTETQIAEISPFKLTMHEFWLLWNKSHNQPYVTDITDNIVFGLFQNSIGFEEDFDDDIKNEINNIIKDGIIGYYS